jgi:hypothetical protein
MYVRILEIELNSSECSPSPFANYSYGVNNSSQVLLAFVTLSTSIEMVSLPSIERVKYLKSVSKASNEDITISDLKKLNTGNVTIDIINCFDDIKR